MAGDGFSLPGTLSGRCKVSASADLSTPYAPPAPWRRRAAAHALALGVIAASVALFHGGTISRALEIRHAETPMFLQHNRDFVHSLRDCFTAPLVYPGLYRPLSTSCYFYAGRKLFGSRIAPYKIVNAVIYAANAYLVFLLCAQLLPYAWSLFAAALFASREAHAHVLLYAIEAQTLLSVFFSLLLLYAFVRARREDRPVLEGLSYACLVLALLSKEPAVAMVGVLVVYGWLFDRRFQYRPYLVHLVLAAGWAHWFFFRFRGAPDARPVPFHYAFAPGDLLGNYAGYLLDFFNPLVSVREGAPEHLGQTIASLVASTAFHGVMALAALACAFGAVVGRKLTGAQASLVRALVFGLAFFFLSMAPYAILQERLFLRYSYVGHVGLAIALSAAFALVLRGARSLAAALRASAARR
jgi:hypothetical protein